MEHTYNQRDCPVDRMVRDMTAQEFVSWLVKYHGLPEGSAETVESNLREQHKWHRLQGRLDRGGSALVIAELLSMRRSSKELERPTKAESA